MAPFLKTLLAGVFIVVIAFSVISSCDDNPNEMDVDVEEDAADGGDADGGAGGGVVTNKAGNTRDGVEDNDGRREGMKSLFQYDPVEVGHVRDILIAPGVTAKIKTVAMKPPLFEVWNLVSLDECDHLIHLGEKEGMSASGTMSADFDRRYNVYLEDGVTLAYDETEVKRVFEEFDLNHDGWIDFKELHGCLPGLNESDVDLTSLEIQRFYLDFDMDSDSNGYLDVKEFWVMRERNLKAQVKDWLHRLQDGKIDVTRKKRGRDRISDQAWVNWMRSDDPVLSQLPQRLSGLTGLHRHILEPSEMIQVARYYPGGHYHAHFDSSAIDPNKDCVHTKMMLEGVGPLDPLSRLCRYITIMTYLSDVEEGGETAFPLADNATYDQNVYNEMFVELVDLTNRCHDANVLVKPEKGKSVMWYNHHVNAKTGWLGKLNRYSLHGGCDVKKGVKWIANHWLTVDDVYERQMKFIDALFSPTISPPQAQPSGQTDSCGDKKEEL